MLEVLIVLLSGAVAGAAWLARRVSNRFLLGGLVLSMVLSIAGVLAGASLYPLTDVLVIVLASSAGILLGRAIPPRFWPFFVALLILSGLDAAQQLLPSGPVSYRSTRPAAYLYTMFVIDVAGAHAAIGFLDLLLAAAIGEHGRRRCQATWRAVLPAPVGLLVADLVNLITSAGNIPLIPFITLAWLIAQVPWPLRPPKSVIAA